MNDDTNDHDQTEEETLTYEVSDEVLEAAAGTGGIGPDSVCCASMLATSCLPE